VLIEAFAAALNFAYLKDKLIAFPKSGGLAAFVIFLLGLLSALAVADWNDYEGRYADPRVLGAVAISPTTTICSMLWVAAFLKTGIAQRVEDGTYNGPILNFVNQFFLALFARIGDARIFGATDNGAGRVRRDGWNQAAYESFQPRHY